MPQPDVTQVERVASRYPSFAGLWRHGDAIHAAFVDPTEEIARAVRRAGPPGAQITVERARWTLAQLQQTARIAERHMRNGDGAEVTLAVIRVPDNQVWIGARQVVLERTRARIQTELETAALGGSALFVVSGGVTFDY